MMTHSRLDEIAARLSKATPGPWKWTSDGKSIDILEFKSPGDYDNPELRSESGQGIITCGEYQVHDSVEDAILIAHAPTDLAYLLKRLKAAEAVCVAAKTINEAVFDHAARAQHWKDLALALTTWGQTNGEH